MNNKELWNRAFTTDPRAVKPITGKQYKGNSPKPYWIVERLTDEFGPCGIGWGFKLISERFERFGETESLHVASIRFWFKTTINGALQMGEFEQVGQTRSSYVSSGGKFIVDEDAPKKSVTDALVKCASYLGFAGDIFSGMWDDSKYVEWAAEEWDRRIAESSKTPEEIEAQKKHEARYKELDGLADYMLECHANGKDLDAIKVWQDPATFDADLAEANEERKYVWGLLKVASKLRSAIKANSANSANNKSE